MLFDLHNTSQDLSPALSQSDSYIGSNAFVSIMQLLVRIFLLRTAKTEGQKYFFGMFVQTEILILDYFSRIWLVQTFQKNTFVPIILHI